MEEATRKDFKEELARAHFTNAEIQYAANNCGVDWYGKALNYAKKNLSDFSQQGRRLLREDMEMNNYDSVDINRVIEQGINWKEAALNYAKDYLNENEDADKNDLRTRLKDDDYTDVEINYALEKCTDWKVNALNYAKKLHENNQLYSKSSLRTELEEKGYNTTEIEYAVSNLSEEWIDLAYQSAKESLSEEPSYTKDELIEIIKNENMGLTDDEISAGVTKALSELES